jgi:hypothetical protein
MTVLPNTIKAIHQNHKNGVVKIVAWIEKDLGISMKYRSAVTDNTILDIHVRHDLDFCDGYCGTGRLLNSEDFHIYTSQTITINIPCDRLTEVMNIIKDGFFDKNIVIKTDVSNQFIMRDHLMANDWNWKTMELSLEFYIYYEV